MRYKDFPKHDFRRCLAVLITIENLAERASLHYVAQELECTRAEVSRAIDLARHQLRVAIEKAGSVYTIASWGFLNRDEVRLALGPSPESVLRWQNPPGIRQENRPMWTREEEAKLVHSVVDAVASNRRPVSDREADIFRLSAQLLRTRFEHAAAFLDAAARQFYVDAAVVPRPFPRVVADGLVNDVPRLRHLLENRMRGVHSW